MSRPLHFNQLDGFVPKLFLTIFEDIHQSIFKYDIIGYFHYPHNQWYVQNILSQLRNMKDAMDVTKRWSNAKW